MAVAKGKLTLSIVAAVVKAKLIVAAAVFGAASCTTAVFPEDPHVESREAIVHEVEGAPPAQAAWAGERLPAAGQGHLPGGSDFDPNPRSLAAATVSLKPEAVDPRGRQLTPKEARCAPASAKPRLAPTAMPPVGLPCSPRTNTATAPSRSALLLLLAAFCHYIAVASSLLLAVRCHCYCLASRAHTLLARPPAAPPCARRPAVPATPRTTGPRSLHRGRNGRALPTPPSAASTGRIRMLRPPLAGALHRAPRPCPQRPPTAAPSSPLPQASGGRPRIAAAKPRRASPVPPRVWPGRAL
nr:uncharacterized protein DKFZp434B061-like [Aegilops tauschii subsp. strangulata]